MDDLVARLQKAIEVTPILPMAETRAQQLPGFYIAVTLDNARNAQGVCTALTSMFIEQNLRLRQENSEVTTQFLAQELAAAKASLDEQDGKLAAFKSHHIGELPDDEQTNLNLLTGLTSQLDASTQALGTRTTGQDFYGIAAFPASRRLASVTDRTRSRHTRTTTHRFAGAPGHAAVQLYRRLPGRDQDEERHRRPAKENRRQWKTVPGTRRQQGPEKSVEPAQIQQLRAQVHNDDLMIAAKTKEQEQIRKQINLYQDRVQSSPAVEQQYKELTRGYQTALDSYNELQKKRDDSAMATNLERKQEGEQFRVLDPANLPEKPELPEPPSFCTGWIVRRIGAGTGNCVPSGDQGLLVQNGAGRGVCLASAGARDGAGDRTIAGKETGRRTRT